MSNELIQSVEDHVRKLFKEKSPAENVFHDLAYTLEQVDTAKDFADKMKLSADDKTIILISSWFLNTGYFDKAENVNSESADYAEKYLMDKNVDSVIIDKVKSAVLAASRTALPASKLEEIICDIDSQYLGQKSFEERGELLLLEFEKRNNKFLPDIEWLEYIINLFTSSKYFTKFAKENYGEQRLANLSKIQKKLKKKISKKKNLLIKEKKIDLEKKKLENKKETGKKAERGIETMFRNVMRTHVSFSALADNKANIMISVNTLLLTAIIAVLARKLDSNPHLIIPTIILTVVSLTTLIYAVLVTRPQINTGVFTKDDIQNKKANLLFFGNFYNMNLDDFSWGMWEMLDDRDYLYNSMIKDFYFLGQVLGKKYKYLRVCYSLFMYGLILSVLAFAVAIALYPYGTSLGPIIE
ncbi:MAG: DUF5706 domain-containing protein [Melioribacteraceae bacterium]|nr:DUF5706 domain-containing protein [Melioribacteraceae bacterium]MCF8355696.1 DUF5706 domain-containing protein [Melioribacteraceae bacterium]MCF8394426.1 DUF5706 domain-containing protein [Melioribacteraceae bacterium]MCF8418560.1 DUF5706 domain-containing protein [Melioribacteraceae bacterium]